MLINVTASTTDVLANAFGIVFLNEIGAMTFEYYTNKIERTRTQIFTSDHYMRQSFEIQQCQASHCWSYVMVYSVLIPSAYICFNVFEAIDYSNHPVWLYIIN